MRGPYNKDYSILGSILGSLNFGKLPYIYIYIHRVRLKQIEYGFGYIIIRSSYTPCSIYLRETVDFSA